MKNIKISQNSETFEKQTYLLCSQHMQPLESGDIPCPNH